MYSCRNVYIAWFQSESLVQFAPTGPLIVGGEDTTAASVFAPRRASGSSAVAPSRENVEESAVTNDQGAHAAYIHTNYQGAIDRFRASWKTVQKQLTVLVQRMLDVKIQIQQAREHADEYLPATLSVLKEGEASHVPRRAMVVCLQVLGEELNVLLDRFGAVAETQSGNPIWAATTAKTWDVLQGVAHWIGEQLAVLDFEVKSGYNVALSPLELGIGGENPQDSFGKEFLETAPLDEINEVIFQHALMHLSMPYVIKMAERDLPEASPSTPPQPTTKEPQQEPSKFDISNPAPLPPQPPGESETASAQAMYAAATTDFPVQEEPSEEASQEQEPHKPANVDLFPTMPGQRRLSMSQAFQNNEPTTIPPLGELGLVRDPETREAPKSFRSEMSTIRRRVEETRAMVEQARWLARGATEALHLDLSKLVEYMKEHKRSTKGVRFEAVRRSLSKSLDVVKSLEENISYWQTSPALYTISSHCTMVDEPLEIETPLVLPKSLLPGETRLRALPGLALLEKAFWKVHAAAKILGTDMFHLDESEARGRVLSGMRDLHLFELVDTLPTNPQLATASLLRRISDSLIDVVHSTPTIYQAVIFVLQQEKVPGPAYFAESLSMDSASIEDEGTHLLKTCMKLKEGYKNLQKESSKGLLPERDTSLWKQHHPSMESSDEEDTEEKMHDQQSGSSSSAVDDEKASTKDQEQQYASAESSSESSSSSATQESSQHSPEFAKRAGIMVPADDRPEALLKATPEESGETDVDTVSSSSTETDESESSDGEMPPTQQTASTSTTSEKKPPAPQRQQSSKIIAVVTPSGDSPSSSEVERKKKSFSIVSKMKNMFSHKKKE